MTTPTPAPDTPQAPDSIDATSAGTTSSETTQQARDLATTLAPAKEITAMFVKGVITAVSNPGTPPTCTVTMDGDTTTPIANVRFMGMYSPVVGDTVMMSRQESGLLIWGQMADGANVNQSGWTAPVLGSGFTSNSFDPVLYRMVLDNGTNKIQMRGRVDISGTPSALWTMPTGMRPLFDLAPVLIAREFGGGSHVAIIDIKASGAINLAGGTVGITNVTASSTTPANTGVTTPPDTGSKDVQHTHNSSDGPNPATPSSWTTTIKGMTSHEDWNGLHAHTSAAHAHGSAAHTHTGTPTPVAFPTFISFNGVEYFL